MKKKKLEKRVMLRDGKGMIETRFGSVCAVGQEDTHTWVARKA